MNRSILIRSRFVIVFAIVTTFCACAATGPRSYYQIEWRALDECARLTTQYPTVPLVRDKGDYRLDHDVPRLEFGAANFGLGRDEDPFVWIIVVVPEGYTVQFLSRDIVVSTENGEVRHIQHARKVEVDSGEGILFSKKKVIDFLEPMVGATMRSGWDPEIGRATTVRRYVVHTRFPGVQAMSFQVQVPRFLLNESEYSIAPARFTELFGDPEEFIAQRRCTGS